MDLLGEYGSSSSDDESTTVPAKATTKSTTNDNDALKQNMTDSSSTYAAIAVHPDANDSTNLQDQQLTLSPFPVGNDDEMLCDAAALFAPPNDGTSHNPTNPLGPFGKGDSVVFEDGTERVGIIENVHEYVDEYSESCKKYDVRYIDAPNTIAFGVEEFGLRGNSRSCNLGRVNTSIKPGSNKKNKKKRSLPSLTQKPSTWSPSSDQKQKMTLILSELGSGSANHNVLTGITKLTKTDVLYGRGLKTQQHNEAFRKIVNLYKEDYSNTTNRPNKTAITDFILTELRKNGARFLKKVELNSDYWEYEGVPLPYGVTPSVWSNVGDAEALAKIKQTVREKQGDDADASKKTAKSSTKKAHASRCQGATTPSQQQNNATPSTSLSKSLSSQGGGISEGHGGLVSEQSLRAKDVLCGRGGYSMSHPGNVNLRSLVKKHKQQYDEAQKYGDKKVIAESLVKTVRDDGGRFLKKAAGQKGKWKEIGDINATAKLSQTLRDNSVARGLGTRKTKKQKTDDDVDMWDRTSIYPKDENEKRELLSSALNGKNVEHALSDEVGLKLYFRMAKAINPSGNPENWTAQARQTLDIEKRLYPVKKQFAWHLLKFPATKPPSS